MSTVSVCVLWVWGWQVVACEPLEPNERKPFWLLLLLIFRDELWAFVSLPSLVLPTSYCPVKHTHTHGVCTVSPETQLFISKQKRKTHVFHQLNKSNESIFLLLLLLLEGFLKWMFELFSLPLLRSCFLFLIDVIKWSYLLKERHVSVMCTGPPNFRGQAGLTWRHTETETSLTPQKKWD